MNNKLLHALFADTDNYEIVRADGSDASALSHAGEVIQSASL